jgi:hypothetical protein
MQLAVARPALGPPAQPAPPPAAESDTRPASTPPRDGWRPPGWAPPLPAITYAKEAATTLLLLLALPYVIFKLLTAPGELLTNVGRRHAQPPR